jgi:hypothetical protein
LREEPLPKSRDYQVRIRGFADDCDDVWRIYILKAGLDGVSKVCLIELTRRFKEKVEIPSRDAISKYPIECEISLHSSTFESGTTIE